MIIRDGLPGGKRYLAPNGNWALWYAMFGAPAIFTVELFLVYFNVAAACVNKSALPIYAIDVVTLLLLLSVGYTGFSIWKDAGGELPHEHGTRTDRSRLMVVIGMFMCALFLVLVLGHVLATVIVGPCIPMPRVRNTPDL